MHVSTAYYLKLVTEAVPQPPACRRQHICVVICCIPCKPANELSSEATMVYRSFHTHVSAGNLLQLVPQTMQQAASYDPGAKPKLPQRGRCPITGGEDVQSQVLHTLRDAGDSTKLLMSCPVRRARLVSLRTCMSAPATSLNWSHKQYCSVTRWLLEAAASRLNSRA